MKTRFVAIAVAVILMASISEANAAAPTADSGVVASSSSGQTSEKPCIAAEQNNRGQV
jgi:hypothetical protein